MITNHIFNGMDLPYLNLIFSLFLMLIDYSVIINGYDFQCLTCDNFIDGPGCGEFTKQIPVRTCRTFCYFAVIHNRTLSSLTKRDYPSSSNIKLTRAIRDCSPYEDMSIEGNLLLESKIGSLSSSASSPYMEIITIKRCNSEQCNNDFYLKADEFLSGKCSLYEKISFPFLFFLFIIIFYFKNMF